MSTPLTDMERQIAQAAGLSEEDFIRCRDRESARAVAVSSLGLSSAELAVCYATGTTPEEFAAAKHARTPSSVGMLAMCSVELPRLQADAGMVDIQLTPQGEFRPRDGRKMVVPSWRIDATIAARVIERFQARTNPLVVDYEHQTLHKEANGQPAPAAAWVLSLQWREGSGLWATAQLTPRAADLIRAGEYRFISPVFRFDPATGEVISIEMVALTNNPAIDGMAPLALQAPEPSSRNRLNGENDEEK